MAEHLQRLKASAEYFEFPFDEEAVASALDRNQVHFQEGEQYKTRLLLDESGNIEVENLAVEENVSESLTLSEITTSSQDRFLYHKTTRRALYNRELARARRQGFAEVVFCNERGEITEGAISNIFVERAGKLYTPPVECGLLPGIYRQHVLATHPNSREKVLTVADLETAEAVYICNSVRGMCKVTFTREERAGSCQLVNARGADQGD